MSGTALRLRPARRGRGAPARRDSRRRGEGRAPAGAAARRTRRAADLTVRFVDVATRRPLTYVGAGRDRLQPRRLLRAPGARAAGPDGRGSRSTRSASGREIVCERSVAAVPHLLALVNLVALSKGVLPLHASAFTVGGLGVLVTGWSKGGKTESPAGRDGTRGSYVGDEWVYLTPTREMLGLPEPIRLWAWHLDQFPELLRAQAGARPAPAVGWRGRARRPAWPAAPRLPGAGLASRVHPLAARQAYLQVPPRSCSARTGSCSAARLDAAVLLLSHSSPEITAEIVEPRGRASDGGLAGRGARPLPGALPAVPLRLPGPAEPRGGVGRARRGPAAGRAVRRRAVREGLPPHPCDIAALGDAVLGAATTLAGQPTRTAHERDAGP